MKQLVKKLVPAKLRSAIKESIRRARVRRAMREISRLNAGELPSRNTLQSLSLGWGNDGYAANIDYLEEVAKRAATTTGPVLECGSGLTTILLGLLAGNRGIAVRSLEHSPEWRERIASLLAKNEITNVEVLNSPLHDYGDFSWYNPPLPSLPDSFQLVVCDGPPGQTKGGRFGLMPVVGERLGEGAVIVLDDADRPGELELVARWQKQTRFAVEVFNKPAGSFARLVKLA